MKVYKEITHLVFGDDICGFFDEIASYVQKIQDKDMEVEIQYSTCVTDNLINYSALILAYTEE